MAGSANEDTCSWHLWASASVGAFEASVIRFVSLSAGRSPPAFPPLSLVPNAPLWLVGRAPASASCRCAGESFANLWAHCSHGVGGRLTKMQMMPEQVRNEPQDPAFLLRPEVVPRLEDRGCAEMLKLAFSC